MAIRTNAPFDGIFACSSIAIRQDRAHTLLWCFVDIFGQGSNTRLGWVPKRVKKIEANQHFSLGNGIVWNGQDTNRARIDDCCVASSCFCQIRAKIHVLVCFHFIKGSHGFCAVFQHCLYKRHTRYATAAFLIRPGRNRARFLLVDALNRMDSNIVFWRRMGTNGRSI